MIVNSCWTCDAETIRPEKDNWGFIYITPKVADLLGLDNPMYECPECAEGPDGWDCD